CIPWGPTFSSHTRKGTFPSRFDNSELLTYRRRLSGVSLIMFGSCSDTWLTNFGWSGSEMSYCCTAFPAKSETYRSWLSYEIRTSAGVEFAGSWITRVKTSLPSLSSQYQTVLAPAQLMNPPRAAGPCIQRTSRGILSRCSTCSTVPAFQSHTATASPTFSGATGLPRKWCGCVQLDVTIRFSSGFTPTSYMYPG